MDDQAPTRPYAETRFDHADQLQFADWTGDHNPLHVDPLIARRLVAGRQVVHGIHIMLQALERWTDRPASPPARLTVDFASAICIGDAVSFDAQDVSSGVVRLRAVANGLPATYVDVASTAPGPGNPINAADCELLNLPDLPIELEPAHWVGRCIRLSPANNGLEAAFPNCARWLGARRVNALGLLSTVVGMVCPGMHSIFSSVSLAPVAGADAQSELRLKIVRFDARYQIYLIDFDGCIRGRIKAFLRPRLQVQPGMQELCKVVEPDEFAGQHAWVIGGSRGLGELTAKLIAAGGGRVSLTYAMGRDEAHRVVSDINAMRPGQAEADALDVENDDLDLWMQGRSGPTGAFYFATPRIFVQRKTGFDATTFDAFNRFYISRFHALCVALSAHIGEGRARMFYPSSVAVQSIQRGSAEYSMSKAAAEVLIEDWNRSPHNVEIVAHRLPRLATDQTATVHHVSHEDNIMTMLPLVRATLAGNAAR